MSEKSAIVAKHISYSLPTGEILFHDLNLSVNKGDRIALIGKNGTGKSTLLKILSGEIVPTTGTVQYSTTSYVEQLDKTEVEKENRTLMSYLESLSDEWWDIQVHYEKMFGQEMPDLSRAMKNLSGGEYMRIKLAIATYKDPKTLLLDEPTNHLDISSKETLKKFIDTFSGGIVMVSHDTHFINQVAKQVWELSGTEIKKYGGNYQDASKIKENEDESRQRRLIEAKKEIKKSEEALIREQRRAIKSMGTGKKMAGDRSMSAMEKGYFKNKATASAGRKSEIIKNNITESRENLAVNKKFKDKIVKLDIKESETMKGRRIIDIKESNLVAGNNELIKGIDISINYGDKILISGKNGSGKTSLIRALLDQKDTNTKIVGKEIKRMHDMSSMYISQRYEQIDKDRTLLDNILKSNPEITVQTARNILGNLLFRKQHEVDKLAANLSGGEMARLAFAISSASPVDLLVLDEPTNNLDIETIKIISETLKQFDGAMIVVSHDINFLKELNIKKGYVISNKQLKAMKHLPTEDGFYEELLTEQS